MRKGIISRTTIPKMAIRIEYEDNDYNYISSVYPHKMLKKDIEEIKEPITIIYSAPTA